MELTGPARKFIDQAVSKFPEGKQRSAAIEALMFVQSENGGYLTNELIKAVANHLDMAEIEAFELASFYSMFDLSPVAKNKIKLCTNISCLLRGSDQLLQHLKTKYDVDPDETSSDGKFTLQEVECLGACCGAPMAMVNNDYHEDLDPEKLDQIIGALPSGV